MGSYLGRSNNQKYKFKTGAKLNGRNWEATQAVAKTANLGSNPSKHCR
jgi:hypothetical protein